MSDALRAWLELEHVANGREAFGMAGVRDPDGRCEAFAPVPGIDMLGLRVTSPLTGGCDGDGHYLCLGCAHWSRAGAYGREYVDDDYQAEGETR